MLLKIQYFEEIIYNYIQYSFKNIYIRLYECIKFALFREIYLMIKYFVVYLQHYCLIIK